MGLNQMDVSKDLQSNEQKYYDKVIYLINNNVSIWNQKAIIDAVDELVEILKSED